MDIDKQLHLGTDKVQLILSPKSRMGVNIFFHTLTQHTLLVKDHMDPQLANRNSLDFIKIICRAVVVPLHCTGWIITLT